jgi:hypothetical protein
MPDNEAIPLTGLWCRMRGVGKLRLLMAARNDAACS